MTGYLETKKLKIRGALYIYIFIHLNFNEKINL